MRSSRAETGLLAKQEKGKEEAWSWKKAKTFSLSMVSMVRLSSVHLSKTLTPKVGMVDGKEMSARATQSAKALSSILTTSVCERSMTSMLLHLARAERVTERAGRREQE